jgi:hypothetical protein
MTTVDLLAALLSGGASIAMGLRSALLKREIVTKPTAPRIVTLALMGGAAGFAGASLNIWLGGHAAWREVICYGGSALAAWVLLGNIWLQKRVANDGQG